MEEKCQLGNFKENQHIEVGYLIQENITISIPVDIYYFVFSKVVCQWIAAGQWFSPGTPLSSTNNTDRLDITEKKIESGVKHHNPKP
jgi:hypothetical protein